MLLNLATLIESSAHGSPYAETDLPISHEMSGSHHQNRAFTYSRIGVPTVPLQEIVKRRLFKNDLPRVNPDEMSAEFGGDLIDLSQPRLFGHHQPVKLTHVLTLIRQPADLPEL